MSSSERPGLNPGSINIRSISVSHVLSRSFYRREMSFRENLAHFAEMMTIRGMNGINNERLLQLNANPTEEKISAMLESL